MNLPTIAASSILECFMASLVEFIEALAADLAGAWAESAHLDPGRPGGWGIAHAGSLTAVPGASAPRRART